MNEVINILKKAGAIMEGSHFVGTSGRHMGTYVNKDALLPHTELVSKICQQFAEKFKDTNIDVIVSPAVAGIPFSQWTAFHLGKIQGKDILSLFTEKTPENDQIFRRGYDALVRGKNVLVLEDTTTLGSSVKKVIESVKKTGGQVVAVCVMINRDPNAVNSETIGVPFYSLAVLDVPSYDQKDCPLCREGVPINTQLGHGKNFLESKK